MSKLYFITIFCVIISISITNGIPTSSSVQAEGTQDKLLSKKVGPTITAKPLISKKSLTESVKPNSDIVDENFSKVGKLMLNYIQNLANDRSSGIITVTKQAIILKVTQILQIIFYITGSAFFVCSIIDCRGMLLGGGSGSSGAYGGGGGLSSIFSRSDFDTYLNQQGKPIIRQIKNAQSMYQ